MWTLKYAALSLAALMVTLFLHEFSHWITGEILGYDMVMTINTGYPAIGFYYYQWHYTLISAVGPILTLLQAYIVYLVISKYSNTNLYPLLFVCFFLELLSGLLNLRNLNDLGRISKDFNLPILSLPAIFFTLQAIMVYKTSKREHLNLKYNLISLFWVALFFGILIGINKTFNVIILK